MKRFPIGIMVDSLKLPFAEGVKKAAALGAQGIQVYTASGEMAPENLSSAKRSEMRRIIEGEGLVISALCGDLGGHGFELAEENPAKVEKSKRIIDLALELGTKVVTTHIGVVPDQKDEIWENMQKACFDMGEYARKAGARFAIETGPEPAELLKSFLDDLGCAGIGVNYDPANLVMVTHTDPVAGVYLLKDYIVHTHAKDGVNLAPCDRKKVYHAFAIGGIEGFEIGKLFNEVPLGQGEVCWKNYLAALEEIGYEGFLTIEREVGEDPAADIGLAVKFLQEQMEK